MIQINSYGNINGVAFGSSELDAIAVFGEPIRRHKNRQQEKELHFSDFILRFDATSSEFREATLLPQSVGEVNGNAIHWDDRFLLWLMSEDPELYEVLGFVISLKLGVAISGFHDNDDSRKGIHAFRYGDWDMFRNRMQPFRK